MPAGVKKPTAKKPVQGLPRFQNIDEMANFFDTANSTELPWEDTDLKFERPKMVQVSIRLPEKDLKAIQRRATKLGIGHTTLIRSMLHRSLSDDSTPSQKGVKKRVTVK